VGNLSLEGDNPHIRIIGKGSKERVISITDLSVQHLNVYLNNYSKGGPQTEFLFYTVIKGKAAKMSESNAERILRKYAAKAKETCPKRFKFTITVAGYVDFAVIADNGLMIVTIARITAVVAFYRMLLQVLNVTRY